MLAKSVFLCTALFLDHVVGQRQYGYNRRDVVRDNEAIAQFFPDVDVELFSPAFTHPETVPAGFREGLVGPTNDTVLSAFAQSLANRNEWMTFRRFCFTSEEGRKIPYLRLSEPSGEKNPNKIRVWVQGAVHGDEPGGDQAVLALLGALDANQTLAESLLRHLEILVVPRYNPDGVFYLQDTFATNLDVNRDHIKLAREHTREIKRQFNKFAPHVTIDVHEYTATRQYGRYHMGADSLTTPGKNLNIHPNIRAMSENLFVPRIAEALKTHGLRGGTYMTTPGNKDLDWKPLFTEAGSDAKIGRNAMGLTQCIAFLSETRGIQLTDQHFQRRVSTGLLTIISILQTAADNAELVRNTIEQSIDSFVAGNDEIVVTDSPRITSRNVSLIDITDNTIEDRPITFRSFTPPNTNLTRARPEAYIIPAAWTDLVGRLSDLGLEVQKLDEPWRGTAQALMISSTTFESEYYEGVVRVRITTEASTKNISLPKDSFLVSTRQKNAALAFVALEPENIDPLPLSTLLRSLQATSTRYTESCEHRAFSTGPCT